MDKSFSAIVEPIKEVLEKYKDTLNVELEGRLGIYNADEGVFDTNIGEESYKKILDMLKSCKKWEDEDEVTITDYFSKNLRLSVDDKGNKKCIEKRKVSQHTFVNVTHPFDFRISVSIEEPKDIKRFPSRRDKLKSREKFRKTFNYDKNSFDITRVDSKNKENEIATHFEYEVEHVGNFSENIGTDILKIVTRLLDATYACNGIIKEENNELPLEELNIKLVDTKIN